MRYPFASVDLAEYDRKTLREVATWPFLHCRHLVLVTAACSATAPSVTAPRDEVRPRLRGPVASTGVWFPGPACAARFGAPRTVPVAELDELAACLATLQLRRVRSAASPDAAILTYGPDLEIEARFADDGTLVAIGYEGHDAEGPLPTLAREWLDKMRIAGDPNGPLAADDAAALGGGEPEHAWLRVCIDTHGTVSDSRALEATSLRAARAFELAAGNWRFGLFYLDDRPRMACALVPMSYPPRPTPASIPPPVYLPDDGKPRLTSLAPGLHRHGVDPVPRAEARRRAATGVFDVCIAETGTIAAVRVLRSTGVSADDAAIARTIRSWTYDPYLDDGKAVAVCTAIVFTAGNDSLESNHLVR